MKRNFLFLHIYKVSSPIYLCDFIFMTTIQVNIKQVSCIPGTERGFSKSIHEFCK